MAAPILYVSAMALSQAALAQERAVEDAAAPVVQSPAQSPAQPPENEISPASPLDAMPDIGIDWPDMAQPDSVAPIPPDPVDIATPDDIDTPVAAPDAVAETPNDNGAVSFADTGEQRRYTVKLTGLDGIADSQFDTRFHELSVLLQGEDKEANLAQINRRMDEDTALLERLLRAKGYYDARIRNLIAAPATGSDKLVIGLNVVPGTQYLLSSVDVEGLADTGDKEPVLRKAFPVKVGDAVDADRILAAQASLSAALGENGFPFSKVEEPVVRVDHEERKGDLDIVVASGGRRAFGNILLNDDRLFNARHVQQIARFDPGDPYTASDVEDLRRAIIATGLVSSVRVQPKDAGDGEHVDLAVNVRPAPLRTVAGELGYGTGEGYRAEISWQHRNFFPPEGAVTARGVVGTQEQSASLAFRRSNFRQRDHVLDGLLSISNIKRDAYDARTITLSAGLERQTNIIFQKRWVWRIGAELIASDERDFFSEISGGRRTFLIGATPVSLTYDGSDDLLNPTRGFRLGGRISPELSFQDHSFGYARVQLDGSIYQPVKGDKLVLAARTRFGSILGSQVSQIAPSRRYYAGGGGSVRGYGYQAIGPRDSNNDPIGGKSLAEFSLEARVRFGNFGVVPFVDAGNISREFIPHFRDLRVGAGVGVRYYSSFGPIRVDVGTPINPQRGDPRIAVYVSLGQAF